MQTHSIDYSADQDEISTLKIQQIKQRTRHGLISVFLFFILALSLVFYRYYTTKDLIQAGKIYRAMRDFSILDQPLEPQPQILEGKLAVTQKSLGTMAWTVLHMATGTFPAQFDTNIRERFMTFLHLFGQLYPCKECGRLFLTILKKSQPFSGNKKKELMLYLCDLHNKMNEQVDLPEHSCEKVVQQWNTCGCKE